MKEKMKILRSLFHRFLEKLDLPQKEQLKKKFILMNNMKNEMFYQLLKIRMLNLVFGRYLKILLEKI